MKHFTTVYVPTTFVISYCDVNIKRIHFNNPRQVEKTITKRFTNLKYDVWSNNIFPEPSGY